LYPSSKGRRSSSTSTLASTIISRSIVKLTEESLDPLSLRIAILGIAKDNEVQSSLDQTDLVLVGGQRVLGVGSLSDLKTLIACLSSCLDGDCVLGEVGGCLSPDGLVEAEVVAEVDVGAAQAAIVLEN
jgi:hypothetical protein